MDLVRFPTTARQLSEAFGLSIVGDPTRVVVRLAPLATAREGSLSFLAVSKYRDVLSEASGSVVLCESKWVDAALPITYLVTEDPQGVFATAAKAFYAQNFQSQEVMSGASSYCRIHETAEIAEGVSVGDFSVVGGNSSVGARTRVHAQVFIGNGVRVGEDCEIFPGVRILDHVTIGNRVKIFPGTIIGSDGFGYFGDNGTVEMPQIGTVVIEDDVRIGAGCTIDRATLTETRLCSGVKLDNLVHVGHNVIVGKNSILCAQVGLAGSVVLEENVILGGQVGLGPGVHVGRNARMGGQAGTSTNVAADTTYSLTPALPVREAHKMVRYWARLPEIWKRLRNLEGERKFVSEEQEADVRGVSSQEMRGHL